MADNTEKLIKAGEYIIDTAEILSYRISLHSMISSIISSRRERVANVHSS